uniref:Uncharacterized protein n=1 Tax=Syphacia muris TaxID=451379 RepID=A0A0N5AFG5_9BILA
MVNLPQSSESVGGGSGGDGALIHKHPKTDTYIADCKARIMDTLGPLIYQQCDYARKFASSGDCSKPFSALVSKHMGAAVSFIHYHKQTITKQ